MPRHLTNLKIEEVSSVDRGAGKGVKVVLFKRDGSKEQPKPDPAALDKALEKAIGACGGKTKDLVDCFKQFHAYLTGAEEKPMDLTEESLSKMIADAIAKDRAEVEKMTVRHNSYSQNLDGDEQKRFQAMNMGDREKYMKDNPIPGEDGGSGHANDTGGPEPSGGGDSGAGDTGSSRRSAPQARSGRRSANKSADAGEEDVNKAVVAENEMLKKRIVALEEKDQRSEFSKRAVTLGMAEADGEMLLKAHRGDPKALEWMESKIKALQTQVEKSGLFSEIGAGGTGAKTAYDELVAKGEEIRRASGGKLTGAQSFQKAMEDNPDLAKREKEERYERINKVRV